jgi:hypothetical protein
MGRYSVFVFALPAILLLLSGCQSAPAVPGGPPDETVAEELVWAVIRYLGKLPGKATHQTKFDAEWDDHYRRVADMHRVDWLYEDTATGDIWFLVSRIAPSIHVKRVAVGIRMRREGDALVHYHEVFRTWKMPEDELQEKATMLFGKMVRGEDLSMYYPEVAGDAYIEFPNAEVYFDIDNRYWISTREDPLAGWRDLYGKAEADSVDEADEE